MKHVNKITLLLPLYCLIINAVVFSCSQKQKSDPPPKQSSQKAGVSSHFFNADMYIAGPLLDSMENEARQIEQRFSVDSDRIQLALQDTANDLKTLFTQRQDLVDTFKILQAKSEILYKHINPLREAIEDAGSELSHRLRQFDRLMHRLRRDYEILAVIKTSQIAANIVRSARGAMCKHGVMPTDSFYTYLQMDFEKCKELFKEINELQMGSYGDHLLDSLNKWKYHITMLERIMVSADSIVPTVNASIRGIRYRVAVRMLLERKDLGFLLLRYSGLDSLIVMDQKAHVYSKIKSEMFAGVLEGIKQIISDSLYLNPPLSYPMRARIATQLIDSLISLDPSRGNKNKKFREQLAILRKSVQHDLALLFETTPASQPTEQAQIAMAKKGACYHNEELGFTKEFQEWFMLESDSSEHFDSLFIVQAREVSCMDQVEGDSSGERAVLKDAFLKERKTYFLRNVPGTRPGSVNKAYGVNVLPDSIVYFLPHDTVSLIMLGDGNRYPTFLGIRGVDTLKIGVGHGDGFYIKWAGDINNDGFMDWIIEAFPHYNIGVTALLMTMEKDEKNQFKVVALQSNSGC